MVNKRTKELNNFLRNSVKVRASLEKQLARDDFFQLQFEYLAQRNGHLSFYFTEQGP